MTHRRRSIFLGLIMFWASSCKEIPIALTPPATEMTELASPVATSGATLNSVPGSWSFYDPHDATWPNILIPSEIGYRLRPDWSVESIGIVYKWWGLADPQFSWEEITGHDGVFTRGDVNVEPEAVQALLNSLSELYPT